MTIHCAVSYFDHEKGEFGYILGADSNARIVKIVEKRVPKYPTLRIGRLAIKSPFPINVIEEETIDSHEVSVDKSLSGENYIGFACGVFYSINNTDFNDIGWNLNDIIGADFNHIEEGSLYPEVSHLRYSHGIQLLVAKKTISSVELYIVTIREDQQNQAVARRIHGLTLNSSQSEEGSRLWYKPYPNLGGDRETEGLVPLIKKDFPGLERIVDGNMQISVGEKLDFPTAKTVVFQNLTTPFFASEGYIPGKANVYCINPNEIVRL